LRFATTKAIASRGRAWTSATANDPARTAAPEDPLAHELRCEARGCAHIAGTARGVAPRGWMTSGIVQPGEELACVILARRFALLAERD